MIDAPDDDSDDEPREPSSPACLAHEADAAYMGFATRTEIAAFMNDIAAADAEAIRKMLPRVRDDLMHQELSTRLREIEGLKSNT